MSTINGLINIGPIFYNMLVFLPNYDIKNMASVCNKTTNLLLDLPKCTTCNALISYFRYEQDKSNPETLYITLSEKTNKLYKYFPDHIGPIYGNIMCLPKLDCQRCQEFMCACCGSIVPRQLLFPQDTDKYQGYICYSCICDGLSDNGLTDDE